MADSVEDLLYFDHLAQVARTMVEKKGMVSERMIIESEQMKLKELLQNERSFQVYLDHQLDEEMTRLEQSYVFKSLYSESKRDDRPQWISYFSPEKENKDKKDLKVLNRTFLREKEWNRKLYYDF